MERPGVALEVNERLIEATEAYEKALVLAPRTGRRPTIWASSWSGAWTRASLSSASRAVEAWKRRLLLCRDEGQSLKMAAEHLTRLGVGEETLREWLRPEFFAAEMEG